MLNLGLMKIRLVSASDLFFLLSADAPFIPLPTGRQAQEGLFRCDLNKICRRREDAKS
jgi:hypothetical protein